MADGAPFPGTSITPEGRADRNEMWKEYTEIRDRGEDMAKLSFRKYEDGDPRGAQVLATLSVAERVAALTYLISKMRSF